jgi:hypothetical protein
MSEENKVHENSNLEITNETPKREEKMEHHPEHHAEHHYEHHSEHHSNPGFKISKLRLFQIATVILAIALIAALAFAFKGGAAGATMGSADKDVVAQKTVEYLNTNFGTTATVTGVEEKAGVYELTLDIQGQNTTVYVTKDGNMIFPVAIDKNAKETPSTANNTQTPAKAATMTKSATPTVELFVMSHCPYGTQTEKGILPVVNLLGSKIDFTVKFVYYSMHGQTEINEELNQYCIQKDFSSKYISYLSCFLKAGNTTECLASTKIDTAALNKCINDTDAKYNVTALFNDKSTWLSGRYPLVNLYKADNDKYKVGGSPTLIINGVEASAGRDSASLLKAVCGAFTTMPSECSTNLSATSPSAGFGYTATGANTSASCGS